MSAPCAFCEVVHHEPPTYAEVRMCCIPPLTCGWGRSRPGCFGDIFTLDGGLSSLPPNDFGFDGGLSLFPPSSLGHASIWEPYLSIDFDEVNATAYGTVECGAPPPTCAGSAPMQLRNVLAAATISIGDLDADEDTWLLQCWAV